MWSLLVNVIQKGRLQHIGIEITSLVFAFDFRIEVVAPSHFAFQD